ncbi:hypothetical protein PsYK624_041830 [Phanerochaete sordida]|uniref:DUF6593 domain-containing protein n=1 Tax=Phanerochaete sordida TaxID=48140 RepID=A0A9P3G5A4_9APHY|nr:hypothetical protein PsYK624_041830 [Phanerochaete sordida]
MNLSLTRNDPLNVELVRPDGVALYAVSTPFKMSGQTTKIMKYTAGDGSDAEASMDEIARINWHYIKTTRIIYKGEILEVNKFLPRPKKFTESRCFVAPNGQTYKWKLGYGWRLKTVGPDPQIVATYHPANKRADKGRIEVDVSVLDFLDLVITTWVYMEKTNRDHGGQANGTSAS